MFFFVCSAPLFYLQRSSFLFAAFLFLYLQRFPFLFAALLFCLQRFFFVCSVPFLFAAFLFCLQRFFFICSVSFLFAAFLSCLQRFFFVCSVSFLFAACPLLATVLLAKTTTFKTALNFKLIPNLSARISLPAKTYWLNPPKCQNREFQTQKYPSHHTVTFIYLSTILGEPDQDPTISFAQGLQLYRPKATGVVYLLHETLVMRTQYFRRLNRLQMWFFQEHICKLGHVT